MIAGIDFGSSVTDIVVLDKKRLVFKQSIFQHDPKKVKDVIERYIVDRISVTGAYASEFLSEIKAKKIHEISSIGKGGLFVSGKKEALVVSIGSGTAMVCSAKGKFRHIGGSAIGARTLTGLGKLLLGTDDIGTIEKLAKKGDVSKVDLMIGDIYPEGIGLLSKNWSASHFGKLNSRKNEDLAISLLNMCAQAIGTMAVLGAKAHGQKRIVLVGGLTKLELFRRIVKERIEVLFDIPVIIPKNSEVATAIGAALCF